MEKTLKRHGHTTQTIREIKTGQIPDQESTKMAKRKSQKCYLGIDCVASNRSRSHWRGKTKDESFGVVRR